MQSGARLSLGTLKPVQLRPPPGLCNWSFQLFIDRGLESESVTLYSYKRRVIRFIRRSRKTLWARGRLLL